MTTEAIPPTLADTPTQASLKKFADALDELRKHLADVPTEGWECSISGRYSPYTDCFSFMVQFGQPPGQGSPLCPKKLARELSDSWVRDGSSWEGSLRGFEQCLIVIHHAEALPIAKTKVEL